MKPANTASSVLMFNNPQEFAMSKYKTSKTEKVLRAIAKKPMSAAEIRSRFNVPNVSALIHDLERQLFDIKRSQGKDGLTRYTV